MNDLQRNSSLSNLCLFCELKEETLKDIKEAQFQIALVNVITAIKTLYSQLYWLIKYSKIPDSQLSVVILFSPLANPYWLTATSTEVQFMHFHAISDKNTDISCAVNQDKLDVQFNSMSSSCDISEWLI